MTEPTPDCPLCGAKLQELQGLIFRMNDLMASALKERRREVAIMKAVVAVNVATMVVVFWRHL